MSNARQIALNYIHEFVQDESIAMELENNLFNTSLSINIDYRQLVYDQIYNLSLILDEYNTGNFNNSEKTELINIINDIKESKHTFLCSVYDKERLAKKNFIAKITFKPEASKGIYKCSKCKGDEFIMWRLQTRSSDEPMTVFRLCVNCGTRGKE